MCILFIFTDPSPSLGGFRAIIAENRDEYYSRPAKTAFRCERTNVIGGRDMEQNKEDGMWLGVSLRPVNGRKFRMGALLNVTGEERKSGRKGRGFLVRDYVEGDVLGDEFISTLDGNDADLNAYNFVAVELSDNDARTYHNSNVPKATAEFAGRKFLGFGNSTVQCPLQKVANGRLKFEDIVNRNNNVCKRNQLTEELLDFLKWQQQHLPDSELQRRAPKSYEYLSSIFVQIVPAQYGTRTHSIITVDSDWNVEFMEITIDERTEDYYNPIWNKVCISAKL